MKSLFSEANNSFPGTNHIFEEKTSKFLNNYLWKFGCKLSVICAPFCVRGVLLLSAEIRSGQPGVDFAQTVRFSRFIACPHAPF